MRFDDLSATCYLSVLFFWEHRMPRLGYAALACVTISLSVASQVTAQSPPVPPLPTTARRPVTDTYHGVAVTDDSRWLANWDDPALLAWWLARRDIAVSGRVGGRYPAHLRPRDRRTASRHDRAHSVSHGTRQRGLERR